MALIDKWPKLEPKNNANVKNKGIGVTLSEVLDGHNLM